MSTLELIKITNTRLQEHLELWDAVKSVLPEVAKQYETQSEEIGRDFRILLARLRKINGMPQQESEDILIDDITPSAMVTMSKVSKLCTVLCETLALHLVSTGDEEDGLP